MSEETTAPEGEEQTAAAAATEEKAHEETVAYERFQTVNQKAKAEAEARKAADKKVAELMAQIEDRESAGLPELERLKKDMERAQKRADEAEAKAAEADKKLADPSDAAAFLNLDDIEDQKDAERAVKRLAGQKKHLIKSDEQQLPGRVLQNGQATTSSPQPRGFDLNEEAQKLADGLKQFASKQ
jgi:hypothetical protein